MPIKTPLFPRTSKLCTSMKWKEWAGYYAVSSYRIHHDPEYFAFRNSVGLLDITPLFKYKVIGRDAARFLARIMARDITKLKVGQVSYCCWCTDDGKVVDDGTVMRRDEDEFFVTSADPCFSWFSRFIRGYDVELKDVSALESGLALQGPSSREVLQQITDVDMNRLRFFRVVRSKVDNFNVCISRTGYTGDLGYEIWVENKHALDLWDALTSAGRNYDIRPAGLDALDVTRVEAGLVLKDADYYNALHALIEERMSSPYEISLGWTVDLEREHFNGQKALELEKRLGSQWALVGLEMNWDEIEALFEKHGLPPSVGSHAWRDSIPIYTGKDKKKQVGYATSGTWSPILKKYIALATIEKKYDRLGTKLQIEFTVEHIRHTISSTIVKTPFFNPKRKRSLPQKTIAA